MLEAQGSIICKNIILTFNILLIEQNAKAAHEVADHGYVLETGRITLTGSGKELLADDRVRSAYLGEAG